VTADGKSLEIFGLGAGEWKWKNILEQVSTDEDQRWIRELEHVILKAGEGRLFDPMVMTFQARRGCQRYRPILYRADTLADGSHVFKIILDEDHSWQHAEFPPTLRTLFSALTMAVRFRYEVLIKFHSHLAAQAQASPKGENIRTELQASIRNIELEGTSRGLGKRETLLGIFSQPAEKKNLQKMYEQWAQIRNDIFRDSEKDSAGLLKKRLSQALTMNQAFIKLASSRLVQLMAKSTKRVLE
jgi:hypothetical protein